MDPGQNGINGTTVLLHVTQGLERELELAIAPSRNGVEMIVIQPTQKLRLAIDQPASVRFARIILIN